MTLILGVEDPENGRAIVFSDSGAWIGDTTQELAEPKVWRCGGWVIAMAGRIADSQSMQRRALLEPTPEMRAVECLSKWVNGVLREIQQRDLALGTEKPNKPAIVAAYCTSVWEVDSIGAVTQTTSPFATAGYCEEVLGAMLALDTVDGLDAMERGVRSMRVARRLNKHIHGRIDWKSTDGDEGSIA